MKQSLLRTLAFCLATIGLIGCNSTPDIEQIPRELKLLTTVSNTSGSFNPDKQDLFSWQSPVELYSEEQNPGSAQVELVTQELNQQLKQKGYALIDNKHLSHYLLQAVIVYGNSLHDDKLKRIYGIEANLGSAQDDYQRGSLLLAISKPSGHIVWRGAVQVFTDPTLPADIRQQRLSLAIASMLSNLPAI